MSGCKNQQDAADDREIERILNMTDDEIIAYVGGEEKAERIAEEHREILKRAIRESAESAFRRMTSSKPKERRTCPAN